MRADRHRAALEAGLPTEPLPPQPNATAGDQYWLSLFPTSAASVIGEADHLPDWRDFVGNLLGAEAPGMTIHELCGPWRPRAIARVLARLIRAAAERGYRTSEIARFFAVSPGLVSQAKYSRSLVKN